MSRNHDSKREPEGYGELESQFILRMPEEPSKVLRELLRTGGNLKDRCTIRLENDMRYGEVRVDHWLMHARVVDLPTIVESMKTIDNKSFYKTADICQMMICKEEAEQPVVDEESPNKNKKKDPFKVEKKFLWPHGITPPSKNVRKRRFRKTLKKKYVEAPEIEKEVKRLLRVDNDAVSVKWEVLSEEEEQSIKTEASGHQNPDHTEVVVKKEKPSRVKQEPRTPKREQSLVSSEPSTNVDVEHDIFGGAVSDSDEEMGSNINVELDENSRLSEYDSRLTDSNSFQGAQSLDTKGNFPTQFAPDMFSPNRSSKWSGGSAPTTPTLQSASQSRAATPGGQPGFSRGANVSSPNQDDYQDQTMSKENIQMRMEQLSVELESLRGQRTRKEQEIAGMGNLALWQRFQDILQNLIQDIEYKEMEYQDLQLLLQQAE